MNKMQMVVFVVLGSVVSVLIWSLIGGCHRPGRAPVSPPGEAGVELPAETEEVLRREGIIGDRTVAPPAATPARPRPTAPPPPRAPSPVPAVRHHTVEPGETLWGISRKYGVSVDELQRANNISDPSALSVGRRLTIPAP